MLSSLLEMIHLDIVELDPLHDLRIVCHVGHGYLEVYAGKVKFFGLVDEHKEVSSPLVLDDPLEDTVPLSSKEFLT